MAILPIHNDGSVPWKHLCKISVMSEAFGWEGSQGALSVCSSKGEQYGEVLSERHLVAEQLASTIRVVTSCYPDSGCSTIQCKLLFPLPALSKPRRKPFTSPIDEYSYIILTFMLINANTTTNASTNTGIIYTSCFTLDHYSRLQGRPKNNPKAPVKAVRNGIVHKNLAHTLVPGRRRGLSSHLGEHCRELEQLLHRGWV